MALVVTDEWVVERLKRVTCCVEIVGYRGRMFGVFYPDGVAVIDNVDRPWEFFPEPTVSLFLAPDSETTVVDASSHIIGHFVPELDEVIYDMPPEPTDEEIERWCNSPGRGYTGEEVLAYLRSLG